MKKGLVLIIAFLFVFSGTAIGFDETEIINKIDQSVLETTDGVWSGPFKARSLWSDMSSGGKESVGVTLNTGQRLVSTFKSDWIPMQSAVASGKNVWVYRIGSIPVFFGTGTRPPG